MARIREETLSCIDKVVYPNTLLKYDFFYRLNVFVTLPRPNPHVEDLIPSAMVFGGGEGNN